MKSRKKQSQVTKTCAASFCRKLLDEEIRSYRFPHKLEPKRLHVWQQRLLSSESSRGVVCYRHFSDKQFVYRYSGKRVDLKSNALPDINIVRRTRNPKDPLDAVCRLCLERSDMDYQLIFPVWPNPDVPTADDIAELFGIVITPNDILPRIVCVTCTTKIKFMKRIRDKFQQNDAILKARFVTKSHKADPYPVSMHTSREQFAPAVEPSHSRSDITPEITAVASIDKNLVDCTSVASGSDDALLEACESDVQEHRGNNVQRFRIINSYRIMPPGEAEDSVSTAVKIEPTSLGSDPDEAMDSETQYPELGNDEVKIEYQPLGFSSLYTEEDSAPEELVEHPPLKKLRVDKSSRSSNRIKVEKSET